MELVSTGVNDPLFAKAMALSQGETSVVFVVNDLCSVTLLNQIKP